jgi:hypothetical protein
MTVSDICEFRVENGITIVRFKKTPKMEDNKAVLVELAANYPQKLRLWDMRNIVIEQSQSELREIAMNSAATFSSPSRVAFVADDDLSFGLLRIFEVFNDQESRQKETRVFRDYQQATDWLLAQ